MRGLVFKTFACQVSPGCSSLWFDCPAIWWMVLTAHPSACLEKLVSYGSLSVRKSNV
jgi:hypothetical protein